MAEAKIKLPNGTEVVINGSPEEIAKVVALYNGSDSAKGTSGPSKTSSKKSQVDAGNNTTIDLAAIVNKINDCDEAEVIESKILDDPDVVNRILMCLYINEKYFESEPSMTTGEISKVLKQLGVPVTTANVSSAISRKANSYVMYDGVRTKGAVIRYSINRRGIQYFERLLNGEVLQEPIRPKPATKKASSKSVSTTSESAKKDKPTKTGSKSPKSDGGYKPKYNNQLNLLGLSEFVSGLVLNNNTEYLIAFCKFLQEKAGLDVVDGDDVYTCFAELKSIIRIPGSFMNTLRNAQNRDHVISYDRGFVNVNLTPKGENLFNHDIVKRKKEEG